MFESAGFKRRGEVVQLIFLQDLFDCFLENRKIECGEGQWSRMEVERPFIRCNLSESMMAWSRVIAMEVVE